MEALLDDNLDFVKLLYGLIEPVKASLAPFGVLRELVFSIGGEETAVSLLNGQSGPPAYSVQFEHPEHIAQLTSADFLTISLYQNNDAANVLWEYNLSGVFAYYKLPHVEHLLKKTKKSADNNKEFRILGGTRTKFSYYPKLDEGDITKYEWSFSQPGTFKEDYSYSAGEASDTNKQTVYWEPEEWKDDHYIIGTLVIELADGGSRTKLFKVTSRELKPDSSKAMEGSDVAMLEEVLWQLGVSPQYGSPGSQGARIDSNRGKPSYKDTETCNAQPQPADDRSVFYTGWSNCSSGQVSLEFMVRRFQGRSTSKSKKGNQGLNMTGVVNKTNGTLDQLKKVWAHYHQAYDEFSNTPYTMTNIPEAWWDSVTTVLAEGGDAPYIEAKKSYTLPATYTATSHSTITGKFPADASAIEVVDILKAWVRQESGGTLWGEGSPTTPYRVHEGGETQGVRLLDCDTDGC